MVVWGFYASKVEKSCVVEFRSARFPPYNWKKTKEGTKSDLKLERVKSSLVVLFLPLLQLSSSVQY